MPQSSLESRSQLASEVARNHVAEPGGLLPALQEIQQTIGFVDEASQAAVAEVFNVSRAQVAGVISFYSDLTDTPPAAARTLAVCRGEACQSVGANALLAEATDRARAGEFGDVSVAEIFCLGNCALGPSVMVDEHVVGRVAADDLPGLFAPEASSATSASNEAPAPVSLATVYVPADAAAVAVGADEVAAAFAAAGADVRRNGSRGLLWAEPLVEVLTDEGRVAYAGVTPADVDDVLADTLDAERRLGDIEEHPWLKDQQRVTFARVGVIQPHSLTEYEAAGGWQGLWRAMAETPEDVCREVSESGLRGRGGAGFPAGRKWETVRQQQAEQKYVCCNADEGDSGTYADRMIIEGDPFTLIEGMMIAGYAVGASQGYIYLRSEYPAAVESMRIAIETAYAAGMLGRDIKGTSFDFDLVLRVGAGAYICGEESSMLESLEGKRGEVRVKPPIPAISGLFGQPTVINNVLTLCSVPMIMADGGAAYAELGHGDSRGTQVFQLGGNIARGGIVEVAFGVTLRELIETYGGGTQSGRPFKAAQIGGPLGSYVPESMLDLPMDYEEFAKAGAMVGHGGIVVFDDTADMAEMAKFAFDFCAEESCGKCTPCRLGSHKGSEVMTQVLLGRDVDRNLVLIDDLCTTMTKGSLCAMGGLTPMPVRSAIQHFGDDFRNRAAVDGEWRI